MEVALVDDLSNYSRLLEKVVCDGSTNRVSLGVELQLKIFTETGGVIVAQRLCISERLQQRIGSQNHVFGLLNGRVPTSRHICNVLHDALRSLGLASTGLS